MRAPDSAVAPGPGTPSIPERTWLHGHAPEGRRSGRFFARARALLEQWILCRGSKVAYLRRLGARIGAETALLNNVRDFGTEPWLIELGSRVNIASGVVFVNHDGTSRVFRRRIPGGSVYGNRFGTIRVLDDCVIGVGSVLLPGITIGPDSIVGANSVVTRDVPPQTVAGGVPARVLSTLDEHMERYREEMIPGLSSNRRELRRQLTMRFWGQER